MRRTMWRPKPTTVRPVTDEQPDPVHDASAQDVCDTPCALATGDVDLDAVERDLNDVEMALSRLAEGTYWTDEVTGEPIAEHVLVADPTARRA
jgi:RNA polymerase-binding transcription factor DksA